MKKLVNGRIVDMTASEIAERQADEAAMTAPREMPRSLEQRIADLEAEVAALKRGR